MYHRHLLSTLTQGTRGWPEGANGRGSVVGYPAQDRLETAQVSAGTQHLDRQWMSSMDFCVSQLMTLSRHFMQDQNFILKGRFRIIQC